MKVSRYLPLLALLLAPQQSWAEASSRTIHAIQAAEAPVLDGRLDDEVWSRAEVSYGFTQMRPDDGADASYDTRVQVAYDSGNLYVALRALDPEPEAILRRIHRRDQGSETDWLGIYIDGYHDKRTARYFMVNAGGVQQDGNFQNDTNSDNSWDGVWGSAVQVDDEGWVAELRIPLNLIRFNAEGDGAWGFEVQRIIGRLGEQSFWAPISQSEDRFVSRFGELEGVRTDVRVVNFMLASGHWYVHQM